MAPSTQSNSARWRGEHVEAVSLAWEMATGADSIGTIERVYPRSRSGAFRCVYPGCEFRRHDAEQMWWHVHARHGEPSVPPDDFDPGPWL